MAKNHNSTTYHFSFKLPIKYKTSDNRGQKCWENSWKQDYFSQIGCSCKIPSPLLPHSKLNKKFHPRATLYGGRGVWLIIFTHSVPTFKLNIRVLLTFSRSFVPDCSYLHLKQLDGTFLKANQCTKFGLTRVFLKRPFFSALWKVMLPTRKYSVFYFCEPNRRC